ncbi:6-carboxytetrahydropterin synthase [bacterium]|jgi:6-pyruvoyltetrahydropterin/6-carboxytetrahydropterin synthase|nr:6-carboxytetrahydropterin synthase [bacterium]
MSKVYLIRKAHFSAAHRLYNPEMTESDNWGIYGPCTNANGHGHNYTLEVVIAGEPDPKTGILMNLAHLKEIVHDVVIKEMDHKNLNLDVPALRGIIPTAENLSIVIWKMLKEKVPRGLLHEIRLRETENNLSIYRGE